MNTETETKQQFSFKVDSKQELTKMFNCLGELTNDITLTLDNEGLTIRTMDPSHVALIDIRIPQEAFENYNVNSEVKIGLRIDEVLKILNIAEKNEAITFESMPEDEFKITIGSNTHYDIRLIESMASDQPLPRIPFDSIIPLNEIELKELIKELKRVNVVSDYVTFNHISYDCLRLIGSGDNGKVTIDHKVTDIETRNDENSISNYSLEYIQPILKRLNGSDNLLIKYSSVKPLVIETKLFKIGILDFYLAPRIEN